MDVVTSFCLYKGVTRDDIFTCATAIGRSPVGRRLQNELSHYQRGWERYQQEVAYAPDTDDQAAAIAHAAYDRLTSWNASLGAISRQEYVQGFIDAYRAATPAT